MNIILIGNNGAGKSTIANFLYKDGYHIFKEAPRGKHHAIASTLCLSDNHIVFDRWNVVDRAIYERELQYLELISMCVDEVNRNNVIFYITNNVTKYDYSDDPQRSVQRADPIDKKRLDFAYDYYVNMLERRGFCIQRVSVEPNPEDTYHIISKIIDAYEAGYGV